MYKGMIYNEIYRKNYFLPLLAAFLVVTVFFASCDDWLEVSPKTQIYEKTQMSRESGFRSQLTGVYTRMCSSALYGQTLTIGMVETLSQNYDIKTNNTTYREFASYNYGNSACESAITAVWSNMYNCITNLNAVINEIDNVDSGIFTGNNYYMCKGEAYGLRAFLHFDLMRLFAQAPAMSATAPGVPYVREYGVDITPQEDVSTTMGYIISDLLTAKECLEHDSLKAAAKPHSFLNSRACYFNYYACVATLARAYMWMGDTENARKYAEEIVDVVEGDTESKPFSWTDPAMLATGMAETSLDPIFSTEHLFQLKMDGWEDIANRWLSDEAGPNVLKPGNEKTDDIFEVNRGYGNDYRRLDGVSYTIVGDEYYPRKLWYVEGSSYSGLLPLIRMTEMFYILAECLKDTNSERAVELLNEVRQHRNITDELSATLSADLIQNEIYKEYRKEFLQEGQLFYYYKRLNAATIPGASATPGKSVYVLPIPSSEEEYGYSN